MRRVLATTFVAALTAACGAGPGRGEVVASGVATAHFQQRARHTDEVAVQVWFPSTDDGTPAPGAARPAVVLIQGGFVGVGRYAWLAEALAARGYVVAAPQHLLDLAFFEIDNGLAARQLLLEPPTGSLLEGRVDGARLAVGGHSLGGVVAAKLAREEGFAALIEMASYPDSADADALGQLTLPSLSLAGRADCKAKLATVAAGALTLPHPRLLAVADGVTHYQFTDSDREDRDGHCTPGATLDAAHAVVVEIISRFLGLALGGETVTPEALGPIDGVEVTAP